MYKPAVLILSILITMNCSAQNPWELGGEYTRLMGKGYQGTMVGGRYESYNNKTSWNIGATYNFTPGSKSYSVHKGFGLFAGFRYGFAYSNSGKGNGFAGVRAYFLFENYEGKARINGLSVMPALEAGYHILLKNHYFISPTIGGGYMLRLTRLNNSLQEDEGGRLLPGASIGYRF